MIGSEHQVCLLLGSNIQPERNLPLAVDRCRIFDHPADFIRLGNPCSGIRWPEFPQCSFIGTDSFDKEN